MWPKILCQNMFWRNNLGLEYSLWISACSLLAKHWREVNLQIISDLSSSFPVAQFGDSNKFHCFSLLPSSAQEPTLKQYWCSHFYPESLGFTSPCGRGKIACFSPKCFAVFSPIYLSSSDNSANALNFPSISIGFKKQLLSSNLHIFKRVLESGTRPVE